MDIHKALEMKKFNFLWPQAYPRYSKVPYLTKIIKRFVNDGIISTGHLFEKAISVQCRLQRESTAGQDFQNGDDAKLTTVRTSGHGRTYSAPVRNIHTKPGCLLVAVFERKLDKWYFFKIPRDAREHIPKSSNIEIPFELDGTPRRSNRCLVNFWDYELPSIKHLS